MQIVESVDQARQHIEANLRGLAKAAMDLSHETRARAAGEDDARLREIWQAEAAAELALAKRISAACDELLDRFALR